MPKKKAEDRSWPSRFGTLGEAVFGPDDPFNYDMSSADSNLRFTSDEMDGCYHPMLKPTDPEYGKKFTSRSQFRAITRDKGGEEVGNEWCKNGQPDPTENPRYHQERLRELDESTQHKLREHLNAARINPDRLPRHTRETLERYQRNRRG